MTAYDRLLAQLDKVIGWKAPQQSSNWFWGIYLLLEAGLALLVLLAWLLR